MSSSRRLYYFRDLYFYGKEIATVEGCVLPGRCKLGAKSSDQGGGYAPDFESTLGITASACMAFNAASADPKIGHILMSIKTAKTLAVACFRDKLNESGKPLMDLNLVKGKPITSCPFSDLAASVVTTPYNELHFIIPHVRNKESRSADLGKA